MKKFIFIMVGFEKPTPIIMKNWIRWFQMIKPYIVEKVGFCNGKKIIGDEIISLSMDENALTWSVTLEVENEEEAIKLAKLCPIITSLQMYEAVERKM